MKKLLSVITAASVLLCSATAYADTAKAAVAEIAEDNEEDLASMLWVSELDDGEAEISLSAGHGYESGLTSIVVPEEIDGLKVVGLADMAFLGCDELTSVTLPNTLRYIGSRAFENCTSLKTVVFPETLTTIGSKAFNGCTSLTSITIPNSVTTLEDEAFYGCSSLESVTMPDVIENIGSSTFEDTPFWNKQLGVKYAGKMVIGCDNSIEDAMIKSGTLVIGKAAFSASQIRSVTIPESVEYIGESAFEWCENLTTVNMPDKIVKIGASAFDKTPFYDDQEGDVKYVGKMAVVCDWAAESVEIEPGTLAVCDNAFDRCSRLESIVIPDSVIEIGDFAFQDTWYLGSVTIPKSVKKIGSGIFSNSGVTSVTILGGIDNIPDEAFYNCDIESLYIPSGVKTIGNGAFSGISSVNDIYFAGTEEEWNSIVVNDNNPVLLNAKIHFNSPVPNKVKIPANVTVTRDGRTLYDGDVVKTDDILKITAEAPEDHALTSLTVNDIKISNGGEFTVGTDDVVIAVEFMEIRQYTITILDPDDNVTVTCDGATLSNNDEITTGDILIITAEVPEDHALKSLTVNGEPFQNGGEFVVTGDVEIAVELTEFYTITIPEYVTVARDGVELTDDDKVTTGDILTIRVNVPSGYKLDLLTVNDEAFKSGDTYKVTSEDVVIAVELTEIEHYTITIPEHVTVTRDGVELTDDDKVTTGDILTIRVNVPSGYRLDSLTVNDEAFKSGDTYKVTSEDVVIAVELTEIEHYTITIPSNVTVTCDGKTLSDGAEITAGDTLTIRVNVPSGYRLDSLTVNDEAFKSGDTYKVTSEDVVIAVELTEIEHYTITIPSNVTVTCDGKTLSDGAEITAGDTLTIRVNVPSGYRLDSLTVNDETFTSEVISYKVTEDVEIAVEFTEIGHYKVKIPANVIVTRDGIALSNNADITAGDILTIRVNVPSGYTFDSLTVNEKTFTSGDTYIYTYEVTSEDVVISAKFTKIGNYTVTIPSNVTVTRGGKTLSNGAEITAGDVLTIRVSVPSGYRLDSLTVNNKAFTSGSTYTVGSENVVIAAKFTKIGNYTVTIPSNVTVTRGGTTLSNGAKITTGDILTIRANVPSGYRLDSLTVNNSAFTSGNTYTVGSENVVIAAKFTKIGNYTVTIPSNVTVTRSGTTLSNGAKITTGDILTIRANVPSGYKLDSLTVNNKAFTSGSTYTVGSENVVITVSFKKLTENKPGQPFNINDPETSGWENISKTVSVSSDQTIRIDMNGATLLPRNILQIIKNNGNKILLKMDEKVSWSIEGKDVTYTGRDVDLKVTLGTKNIPEAAIKRLVENKDYLTLTLEHNGELGFKGLLVVELGAEYNAKDAALYRYDNNAFTAEGNCDIMYGKGVMEFTHASEWIVVFGKSGDDPNSNNSGTSNSGTSNPDVALPNENDKNNPNKNNSSTSTSNSSGDTQDKENPVTGVPRVSLTTFLALVASAAVTLVTRKRKQ